MRVLSWNLFHGRSVPDSPRELLHEFADTLAGWEWDVAVLQECPPWWPAPRTHLARHLHRDGDELTGGVFASLGSKWTSVARIFTDYGGAAVH